MFHWHNLISTSCSQYMQIHAMHCDFVSTCLFSRHLSLLNSVDIGWSRMTEKCNMSEMHAYSRKLLLKIKEKKRDSSNHIKMRAGENTMIHGHLVPWRFNLDIYTNKDLRFHYKRPRTDNNQFLVPAIPKRTDALRYTDHGELISIHLLEVSTYLDNEKSMVILC